MSISGQSSGVWSISPSYCLHLSLSWHTLQYSGFSILGIAIIRFSLLRPNRSRSFPFRCNVFCTNNRCHILCTTYTPHKLRFRLVGNRLCDLSDKHISFPLSNPNMISQWDTHNNSSASPYLVYILPSVNLHCYLVGFFKLIQDFSNIVQEWLYAYAFHLANHLLKIEFSFYFEEELFSCLPF